MAKKKNKSKSNGSKSSTKSVVSETSATPPLISLKPVLQKVCRLCETKDGPFLNIFDSDKATAKKIDDLMPFGIAENDGLPHKICFRCSAKVEELHEFVQKCVKTQENLLEAAGRKDLLNTKTKTREQWEEKLNQSNMSNDDICDALIKKAMEAIKDMPLHKSIIKDGETPLSALKPTEPSDSKLESKDESLNLKPVKLTIEKCDQRVTRLTRSTAETSDIETPNLEEVKPIIKTEPKRPAKKLQDKIKQEPEPINEPVAESSIPVEPPKEETVPFNIMDHVSVIKVNQVGVLFQCKLCNRNFLKKEIVESHFCARNGAPKADITKNLPPPDPPKVTNTVKYIKMDSEKRIMSNASSAFNKANKDTPELAKNTVEEPIKPVKPKPKIGPASKMKKRLENPPETTQETTSMPRNPVVNFPAKPNLHTRYKLMPGPNNSFVLVEEDEDASKSNRKRKSDGKISDSPSKSTDIIDVDEPPPILPSQQKPYPVGLFQTVAHHTGSFIPEIKDATPTFTTPAMKKQSYTVHQTDNPSKLVISTKPQLSTEELPKKKSKKTKVETRDNTSKEPFSVTLEDAAPPKGAGFFTFINVDPLLQPSYVLPTDNIIQESQISTSTPVVKGSDSKDKEKYSCNMCSEQFSREKKLLSHIQSHFNKLDEEDLMREEKTSKRKRK